MMDKIVRSYYDYWVQMNAWYDKFAKENQITVSQLSIYISLEDSGFKSTIGNLIHYTQIPKQTMTSILNQLEKEGIIDRTENPNDRRSKFIEPTEDGYKQMNEVLNNLHSIEKKAFNHLGTDNGEKLNQLSHMLLNHFEAEKKS